MATNWVRVTRRCMRLVSTRRSMKPRARSSSARVWPWSMGEPTKDRQMFHHTNRCEWRRLFATSPLALLARGGCGLSWGYECATALIQKRLVCGYECSKKKKKLQAGHLEESANSQPQSPNPEQQRCVATLRTQTTSQSTQTTRFHAIHQSTKQCNFLTNFNVLNPPADGYSI